MSSGKQLAFSYGEVSETLRFRSQEAYYANALARLRNGYVRKEGGVSNRQGFQFIDTVEGDEIRPFQANPYRLMTYRIPNSAKRGLLYKEQDFSSSYSTGEPEWSIWNFLGEQIANSPKNTPYLDNWHSKGGKASDAQITQFGDYAAITFGRVNAVNFNFPFIIKDVPFLGLVQDLLKEDFLATGFLNSAGTVQGWGNLPDNIPVGYMSTAVYEDGTEKIWSIDSYSGQHPHPTRSSELSFTNIYNSGAVRYNIYRSAGSLDAAWGLVASFNRANALQTSINFNDYVVAADILFSPPINSFLWGTQRGSIDPQFFYDRHVLRSFTRSMIHQQRLFYAFDVNDYPAAEQGEIGVSKVGAPTMLNSPNIYRNSEAFSFRVPISSGDFITAMVPAKRPIIGTTEKIFVLMGAGEQGAILPTEINPEEVSSEGISSSIAPIERGNGIIYLNYEHTKLMFLGIGGQSIEEAEIAILSKHLINDVEIADMKMVKGVEDIVYLLRADGKLVAVALGEGTVGFSLIETDGNIVAICASESPYFYEPMLRGSSGIKRDQEELMALINRDGQLTMEILRPRTDEDPEGFLYCDSYAAFGTRLARGSDGIWHAIRDGVFGYQSQPSISLSDSGGTGFSAGETVLITSEFNFTPSPNLLPSGLKIGEAKYVDIYYDDENGNRRTLRWERTGSPSWDGSTFTCEGFFNVDVPAQLQNVLNYPAFDVTPNYDINGITTRWVIPVNEVTGLNHLNGKEVSVFADGEVISSPLNTHPSFENPTIEVESNEIDLPDYYGYGVVGLPYEFEMETLPLEAADNRTFSDAKKSVTEIGAAFYRTRGGFVGTEIAEYNVQKMEPIEYPINNPIGNEKPSYTGHAKNMSLGNWSDEGKCTIKQVDPLPITVVSVYPKGIAGD